MPTKWTFITNHAVVLTILSKNPQITALELARKVGITERAARKIIADLFSEGYITKTKIGRRIEYHVYPDMKLRHPLCEDVKILDLLDSLRSIRD